MAKSISPLPDKVNVEVCSCVDLGKRNTSEQVLSASDWGISKLSKEDIFELVTTSYMVPYSFVGCEESTLMIRCGNYEILGRYQDDTLQLRWVTSKFPLKFGGQLPFCAGNGLGGGIGGAGEVGGAEEAGQFNLQLSAVRVISLQAAWPAGVAV